MPPLQQEDHLVADEPGEREFARLSEPAVRVVRVDDLADGRRRSAPRAIVLAVEAVIAGHRFDQVGLRLDRLRQTCTALVERRSIEEVDDRGRNDHGDDRHGQDGEGEDATTVVAGLVLSFAEVVEWFDGHLF
ncbi:MAG: hypothetical protein JRE70_05300 [Deltaproteobacteria bacterium]|nr:hypothetical protein [Deltaproteobacteria bacterium]